MATAITTRLDIQASAGPMPVVRPLSAPYWTSMALTAVSATAAAFTFFAPGVLNGTPVMNGSARGTALVALVIAIPILTLAMVLAGRGDSRAVVAWLGAAGFLQYNAVLFPSRHSVEQSVPALRRDVRLRLLDPGPAA